MKRKRSPGYDMEVEIASGPSPSSSSQNIDPDRLLIDERKKEKRRELKEKLQQKLKTIRDRRVSGVNHEPFPEGAFERLQSNKIWDEVLGYLTEPSDVTSAYFACGTFAGILKERRRLLMMGKVLNVFRTKADEAFEVGDQKMGWVWYKNWEGICLSARGVSKAWKKTADLELFEYDLGEGVSVPYFGQRTFKPTAARFQDDKSVNRITALLQHYSHNQNQIPSIVRRVEVDVNDRITQPLFAKLMAYLRTHGRHVLSLDFKCGRLGNSADPADVYERFCEMLECMPNLRNLYFRFNTEQGQGTGEALQNFQRKLNERPIPSLASLMHLECFWETNNSLLSQILRKSGNLRSVRLPCRHSVAAEVTEPLMEAHLEHFLGRPTIIISNDQFPWPLKHLELNGEVLLTNASLLIPAINRFRETLQCLFLACWPRIDSDSVNVRLDLPHLKIFSIYTMGKTMDFDDLLLLKALEKVIVAGFYDEDTNAKVKVKKFRDSGEMDKSNVWQCFPNLKRLNMRSWVPGSRGETFDHPVLL